LSENTKTIDPIIANVFCIKRLSCSFYFQFRNCPLFLHLNNQLKVAKNENLQRDGPLGPTGSHSHPSINSSAQVHTKADFFKARDFLLFNYIVMNVISAYYWRNDCDSFKTLSQIFHKASYQNINNSVA
jgi:hypothetical protein